MKMYISIPKSNLRDIKIGETYDYISIYEDVDNILPITKTLSNQITLVSNIQLDIMYCEIETNDIETIKSNDCSLAEMVFGIDSYMCKTFKLLKVISEVELLNRIKKGLIKYNKLKEKKSISDIESYIFREKDDICITPEIIQNSVKLNEDNLKELLKHMDLSPMFFEFQKLSENIIKNHLENKDDEFIEESFEYLFQNKSITKEILEYMIKSTKLRNFVKNEIIYYPENLSLDFIRKHEEYLNFSSIKHFCSIVNNYDFLKNYISKIFLYLEDDSINYQYILDYIKTNKDNEQIMLLISNFLNYKNVNKKDLIDYVQYKIDEEDSIVF